MQDLDDESLKLVKLQDYKCPIQNSTSYLI